MPYNGDGTYSLVYNWENDAANGIPITASRMDGQESDMANNGFANVITRDGQSPASANIPMGGFKLTGLANGTLATDAATFGQLTTIVGGLVGFLGGLTLSTAGSSSTFGISAGTATDSTNSLLMSFQSAFTKTTAIFAAGTGNGALDTGVVTTNTWYHVYLIGASATASDILFSLSATTPTLPATYTVFRRIGSMVTDGSSHWMAFTQLGNEFLWKTPVFDMNHLTSGVTTAILTTISTPLGVETTALNNILIQPTVTNSAIIYVSSPDVDDVAASVTTGAFSGYATSASSIASASINTQTRTNMSQQIRLRFIANDTIYYGSTRGWIDLRGQG